MKCSICSFDIPEGKKCCPKCGRVMTASELQRAKAEMQQKQQTTSTASQKTAVYKPASSAARKNTQTTIHIPDIFSSDPNAPEYTDPHAYDRATADILEYDRMFVSRNEQSPQYRRYEEEVFPNDNYTEEPLYAEAPYDEEPPYDDEEAYYEEENNNSNVIRDARYSKPHLKFNAKMFVIALCVIISLVFVGFGVYKIGAKLHDMRVNEPSSSPSQGTVAVPDKATEPSSVTPVAITNPVGIYTVNSTEKDIYMYRTEQPITIFATVPNKTVIKIEEISGKMGKTTYGAYTGWVNLSDLQYSPDAHYEETTKSTETTAADPEANTPEPGIYTVDLHGTSDHVNVRDIGSTSGTIITTLRDGVEVEVTAVKSGWGQITVDGAEGWVYMDYLKQ